MDTQDVMHQAQDAFDRLTRRTAPLLPVHHKNAEAQASGGASSVLANVAPPASLPSFIASPLPAVASPLPPVASPLPPAPAPRPPGPAAPAPPAPAPAPAPAPPAPAPAPALAPAPAPAPAVCPPMPPLSQIPVRPPSAIGAAPLQPPPTSMAPTGPPPTSMSPLPSGPSPIPSPIPTTQVPPAPTTSVAPPQATAIGTAATPKGPPLAPVTSQPQLSIASSVPSNVRGHTRHHSYPVYIPGNPMHNPPPPPTPPCLVVHQQEQLFNPSVRHSTEALAIPETTILSSSSSVPSFYGQNLSPSSSIDMGSVYYRASCDKTYSFTYSPTVDASVELGKSRSQAGSGNPSWFGWIRGTMSSVSHKVAEKAKNSMDSMITTLDPQMKEYIYSGGDVDLVVASDKEVKVGAVREAFQAVFGKATVSGIASEAASVAAQPVGFASALTAGEDRINSLRGGGKVHPQQPVVAVENFIVELTPGFWYDMGLLLLDDPGQDILLQTYTQVTPIPAEYVTQARASTPEDYPLKDSGFATTIGQVASQALQVHHSQWQETVCGVPRREMVTLAARVLASLYKAQLPQSF